jgi:hypothetical protein
MSTIIADTVLSSWQSGRKTKRNSHGWYAGNAICCVHNGESADKRGRGGLIVTADSGVSYSCFNCSYKVSYTPGYQLSYKFRKFLKWLNVDDQTISRLSIEALREQKRHELLGLVKPEVKKEELKVNFKKEPLPEEAVSFMGLVTFYELANTGIANNLPTPSYFKPYPDEFVAAVDYIDKRRSNMQKYDFYWTPNKANKMNKRVIIPFTWKNEIVGYSARAMIDDITPKYYQRIDSGYVFNIDKQEKDWKFVLVLEGVFDAIGLDGVAVLKADVTKQQIDIIENLDREIIVVPDFNKTGQNLIDVAIQNGWSVAFPVWAETCQDANQAIQKYGKLFVLKTILDSVERNTLKIQLLRNRYGRK